MKCGKMVVIFSVFAMMAGVMSTMAADELPVWTIQSWWDFSTTMDIHIQESGSAEYVDFVVVDNDTRHHLVTIEQKTLTHGTPLTYTAYILEFDGIVNAEGTYHIVDPVVTDIPMEIRNATVAGEWWVDTATLGTIYSIRHIQGPLWAYILFSWQQIGTVDITIHEEYEPPRDVVDFPIEVGDSWQPSITVFSYGDYIVNASLFGQPFYREGTFDESALMTMNMTVPSQQMYGGFLAYRIEGADTASPGTTLSYYAAGPQTVIYDHMQDFGSSGGLMINEYTRMMGTYHLEPVQTPTPTPDPDCVHHGDANLDGEVTAGDAQRAFLIVLGLYSPSGPEFCAADCNADGEVTAGDAQAIFLKALGSGTCVDGR